jgi:type I restriction-modification system DNA methylase subunit
VREEAVLKYVEAVKTQYQSGHAREHAYRPALERLMTSFEDITAINDPKRSQHGNPDFVFVKKSNSNITFGYAEAKDITIDLDKALKTEQLRRYAGYDKLFLTNYLDFKFFRNGEQYEEVSIGRVKDGQVVLDSSSYGRLRDVLEEFINQGPTAIRSGKLLSVIMGGKARRIRDNVQWYLSRDGDVSNQELEKIYAMMRKLLVHDLTIEKFSDMYAQTLVYGLFAARYNDKTPDSFTRSEARDLVPKSNPFLREFFDHIAGPRFDERLRFIVDELCEVFSVSNVNVLVQKHLRLFEVDNDKDPVIHFYEDFLKEYDPAERKRMGAYYTPIPVVKFIISQVDRVLKEEFGLAKGLADTSNIEHTVSDAGGKKYKHLTHRVQILDPAVGTATFLNETIHFIRKSFDGQEGRWGTYVEQDLLPRLHGFELMMAPYTIAHLKLGMTLQETGIEDFNQRLGVYLTNTLEEGQQDQVDFFSHFGLAEAVSQEANEASKIKHDKPIMVVVGNPPYSVSSNNKSPYIDNLLSSYKKDLNERNIQPLSDDYIKFIRFAEAMIVKNGEGVVAMITNNSYIDGLIHRQMRKHLLETFDSIYILDLHGNSKKKESAPDGSKDVNVFDIQQGVSIVIAVKTGVKKSNQLGKVYHSELYGTRRYKFDQLKATPDWTEISPSKPNYYFVPKDESLAKQYLSFTSLRELMPFGDAGIKTHRDNFAVDIDRSTLERRIQDFYNLDKASLTDKYKIKDTHDFSIEGSRRDSSYDASRVQKILYRPFDARWAYYSKWLMDRPRERTMNQFIEHENIGLAVCRQQSTFDFQHILVTNKPIDMCAVSLQTKETAYEFPLYVYHDDQTRTPNFNPNTLSAFTTRLSQQTVPEDILDYIYARLHSPRYRQKYKELLKADFPRIPAPKNDSEFIDMVSYGKELRELHLMSSARVNDFMTTYPVAGTDIVEGVEFIEGKIWINQAQFFGNVSEQAWQFYVGGYPPVQKWLKDRKGRRLTSEEIEHYQRIIKIMDETHQIMLKIDATGV